MKNLFTSIAVCFFLTGLSLCSYSQDNGFLLKEIQLPGILKKQIITHVEKDNSGLLWFVTNSGLFRYDGNEAIHLDRYSRPGIVHSSITDILADQNGNLWIGGLDGLTRFNLKDWETIRVKTGDEGDGGIWNESVQSIGQSIDGRIYAGTLDGKLYQVVGDSLDLVVDISRHFGDLFPMASIYSIEEAYPGELWMRTEIGKVVRINIDNREVPTPEYFGLKEFEGQAIRDIYFHPSGNSIFYIPRLGLYLFDTRSGSIEHLAPEQATDLGKTGSVYFAPFNDDEVLIFTNQPNIGKEKLFRYHFHKDSFKVQPVSFPEYLQDNYIDWLQNTGSTLLMSLNNLIVQLVPVKEMFASMFSEPVAINSIRSVYKHTDGKLLVGSYKDRFISVDEASGRKKSIANPFVYDMLHWNADTLVVSTEGDGLFWYEINKERLTPITLSPDRGQNRTRSPRTYMTMLARADDSSLWVGTYSGLLLVNPYKQTFRPIRDDQLVQTKILSLSVNEEKVWLGTPAGLAEWDSRTDSLRYPVQGYPVYCITRVGSEFWIGTEGKGILVLDKKGAVKDTIDNRNGLTNDIVYSLEEEGGFVVAGTQNGLSIINRETNSIQNYSQLDQLPANEFNHSASFSQGDTAYFGTINGLVRFSISDAGTPFKPTSPEPMPLLITSLTTGRSGEGTRNNYSLPYQAESRIEIEAGTPYFSISFGGLSEYASQLQYFYKIGEQTDWFSLGNRQEITFAEMPPGKYNIELTARLPDGHQIGSVLQVPLTIKPSMHQTLWFKGLIVLFILLILWGIFKYRENVLRKERKLRIKIASDLHDEVGSSLTRIFFQADMLSSGYQPSKGGEKQLKQIADTSKNALLTMSDMVWSIDSRFDTVQDLITRMKDYLYKLREELEIDYKFDARGNPSSRPVSQIVRQNLLLIFKEALTNAIKYGDGSEITIELNLEPSMKLIVRNYFSGENGLIADRQGGRGLEIMRQRAEKMGAELVISTEEGMFQISMRIK